MNSRGYYRLDDYFPCNISSEERPILVNCAGSVSMSYPFTTDNQEGRKDYYLMYMLEGFMDAEVKGMGVRLTAGDAVIFPPNKPYRYTGIEPVKYYWAHFTGSDTKDLLQQCGLQGMGVFKAGECESMINFFKLIFDDFIRHDDTYQLSAAVHLTSVLIDLSRRISTSAQYFGDMRICKSIRYIHHHFSSPIKIAELAEMEYLSVAQYNVIFRRCTGKSPLSYIIELRIANACEMILNTDLSIKNIALTVGYEDPQYFSRIFKQYRGMSPERYKLFR